MWIVSRLLPWSNQSALSSFANWSSSLNTDCGCFLQDLIWITEVLKDRKGVWGQYTWWTVVLFVLGSANLQKWNLEVQVSVFFLLAHTNIWIDRISYLGNPKLGKYFYKYAADSLRNDLLGIMPVDMFKTVVVEISQGAYYSWILHTVEINLYTENQILCVSVRQWVWR